MRRTAIIALALALAGCSGSGDGDPADTGGTAARDDIRTAALQYTTCMRERGYDIPDPTFDERGVPRFEPPAEIAKSQRYDEDRQACSASLNSALQAAGIPGKPSTPPEQLLPFTRCVREQGVNIADPDPVNGLVIDKAILTSPAWPAAVEACQRHLPPGSEGIGKTGNP